MSKVVSGALPGQSLVPGLARGDVIYTTVPISFWMGVDTNSGIVIDRHHPLCGTNISGKMLVLPGGRGSCSGSCGLLELIVAGFAPAALIFESADPILALGSLLAAEIFNKSIPVVSVGPQWFRRLASAENMTIDLDRLVVNGAEPAALRLQAPAAGESTLELSARDKAMLAGDEGQARQAAMRIIRRFAEVIGAPHLIDVEQGHIDCCFYTGPAGLAFAERLVSMGGRLSIPTTTNASSVDARRWKSQGIEPTLGTMSDRVAAAYVNMGAKGSFTCAPYLLSGAPTRGQQIAWGESNAVAYANSVIGARTMKYPDMLDVCVALTGRAPYIASHADEGRRATLHIDVAGLRDVDDAFYPLLGYHIGSLAGYDIPVITGLEGAGPNTDDLKAFSAAFATTSGAPMFHIVGVTPEASSLDAVTAAGGVDRQFTITREDLRRSWHELNSATDMNVGLVSLGNPHFSLTEIARTADLCRGRTTSPQTRLVITCGRELHAQASEAGLVAELEAFGVEFWNDTCWCMVDARQMAPFKGAIMTNSAKFAHYGPGITNRTIYFASLASCIAAACSGLHRDSIPGWLRDER